MKIYDEFYKKKNRSLKKKDVLSIITEILIVSRSALTTSTISILNPSIGIVLTSSTALLTSIAVLITIEYISKLNLRYTQVRDWINVFTLVYEKTLKQSIVEKNR